MSAKDKKSEDFSFF